MGGRGSAGSKKPRRITFYAFVPDSERAYQAGPVSKRLDQRTRTLEQRLAAARTLTRLELLPGEEQLVERLSALAEGADRLEDPELAEVSPVLTDLTVYHRHRGGLGDLGEDFCSARVLPGVEEPVLYTLVRHDEEVAPLLYRPRHGAVEEASPDQVFELIRCQPETPVASVDPDLVEEYRSRCVLAGADSGASKTQGRWPTSARCP